MSRSAKSGFYTISSVSRYSQEKVCEKRVVGRDHVPSLMSRFSPYGHGCLWERNARSRSRSVSTVVLFITIQSVKKRINVKASILSNSSSCPVCYNPHVERGALHLKWRSHLPTNIVSLISHALWSMQHMCKRGCTWIDAIPFHQCRASFPIV